MNNKLDVPCRIVWDESEEEWVMYIFGGEPDSNGTHPRYAMISSGDSLNAMLLLFRQDEQGCKIYQFDGINSMLRQAKDFIYE